MIFIYHFPFIVYDTPMRFKGIVTAICLLVTVSTLTRAEEQADVSGFYAGPAIGGALMDSRLPVRGSVFHAVRLGYDFNSPYSLEATAAWHPTRTEGGASLNAFRGALDCLYHFTRWERMDPFLNIGGGVLTADRDVVGAGRVVGVFSCGGGAFYHLTRRQSTERFSLRGDVVFLATTYRGLCAVTGSLGVVVRF